MAVKSRENSTTTVKREAKFLTRYMKGVQFVNRRYEKGEPFLLKMGY